MNIETRHVSGGSRRSWSDLPMEILSSIADRLSILELLSFRGTCKDFRAASSTATAENDSCGTPWLLFHKTNSPECLIHDEPRSESYKRDIPDLEGTICLASYQGRLLVFKADEPAVFFFCPFSLAKIPLPDFPASDNRIEGHVAAVSDPPTSRNCVVSVLNPKDDDFFEITMISKGEKEWTRLKISRRNLKLTSNLTAATFDEESRRFYYMDNKKYVLAFKAEDKSWEPYMIYKASDVKEDTQKLLPYINWSHYLRNTIDQMRDKLDIEHDEYVAICGLSYHHPVYRNEVVDRYPGKNRVA